MLSSPVAAGKFTSSAPTATPFGLPIPRPLQAALISAASFSSLAVVPIAVLFFAPERMRIPVIAAAALLSLGLMGALGGHVAGAPRLRAALRVLIGGGLAMAVSALVGRLFGVTT
jgi:VIT1/CCC1 family predicted Fe2+/Mn2+ transporter